MVVITHIRISNGHQSHLLTRTRTIRVEDLEKYRRRLQRLFHAEVDFTYKNFLTFVGADKKGSKFTA